MTWLTMPAHARWLEQETDRLLSFGAASARDTGGFARLDDDGAPLAGPTELWITCRMTHVYSLGVLLGRPGSAALVDHGLAALDTVFRDAQNGGWFAEVGPDGAIDDAKAAYPHAFVVLATASASAANRPGARALLNEALALSELRFWDDEAGMAVESWDRTFTTLDPYRGVNANMHTVEAYLAAADVTGHRIWLDRAVRIIERVVHGYARGNSWRIPEHFTTDWQPNLDYNIDAPADQIGVVLAHELGHRAHRHVVAFTVLGMGGAAFLVALLRLLRPHPVPHDTAFFQLVAALLDIVARPALAALSRRFERAADRFSLELTGDREAYHALHHDLAVANLSELQPPRWLYYWRFTHPTPSERLAA